MQSPHDIAVCSWSLLVTSVAELRTLLDKLQINSVQIACGDPEHASWEEGDDFVAMAKAAGFHMIGAMIGFPGEDYTSPLTIKKTGGFADPALRAERLEIMKWALERTRALGLHDLTLHAGFIPEVGDSDRKLFLDTLAKAANAAREHNVTLGFETGQETAQLLRRTLEDLKCPNLKVNFDPANMLMYDMGDPIEAIEVLGPHIGSVHVKDANRPAKPGVWGQEMPLGKGQVNVPRFLEALCRIGYRGPLCIERGSGTQAQRVADVADGIKLLKKCLSPAA